MGNLTASKKGGHDKSRWISLKRPSGSLLDQRQCGSVLDGQWITFMLTIAQNVRSYNLIVLRKQNSIKQTNIICTHNSYFHRFTFLSFIGSRRLEMSLCWHLLQFYSNNRTTIVYREIAKSAVVGPCAQGYEPYL